MDFNIFVKNAQDICKLKGIQPTIACRESGVGVSFLSDIKRGRVPSVEKVQIFAEYLGVTVSELIGESAPSAPELTQPQKELMLQMMNMAEAEQEQLLRYAKFAVAERTEKAK